MSRSATRSAACSSCGGGSGPPARSSRCCATRDSACHAERSGRGACGGRRATYGSVHAFLTNPAYAGAFVFGRTSQKKPLDATAGCAAATIDLPLEQWSVCLPEHHPGYVTWDEYLATRERLRANVRPRGEGGGAAREGVALLQGHRPLRTLRPTDAGRLFGQRRAGPPLCVRARASAARHRQRLPVTRRAATGEGRHRRVPGSDHPGRRAAPARRRSASSSASTRSA